MRWWLRIASGLLGITFLATACLTFFYFVPSSWGPHADDPIVVGETVRARSNDGWHVSERYQTIMLTEDEDGFVAAVERAGTTGPVDRSVRVLVGEDMQVHAAGASSGALWSFPVRDPFAPRPGNISLAVVRMDSGLPLVVAVDRFQFQGTGVVDGLEVEHWMSEHPRHRFVDDGRRIERVAERHVWVEPISGVIVSWQEHEQLWTHWGDRLRAGPVEVLIDGPVSGRDYLPIWDAWTNTTEQTEHKLVELAKDVRASRLLGMVGWSFPALLAGELGLWWMISPPRRLLARFGWG